MSEEINVTEMGLTPAEAVVRLYNAARPVGMGCLHPQVPITVEEAEKHLERGTGYIDYLNGRPLKVSFRDGTFDPRLYERDQGGPGAALRALQAAE